MSPGELNDECMTEASSIARLAQHKALRVACAESLTSGAIASHLGAASSASEWFAGGVVAYSAQLKFDLLGVERGPVVTATAAEQMARGVAKLASADVALAVTGEGGPEPAEDAPVGTVYVAVWGLGVHEVREFHFDGGPGDIVHATALQALRMLRAAAEK
ncbi:CinA family protein [Humibacter ginsengisoli]